MAKFLKKTIFQMRHLFFPSQIIPALEIKDAYLQLAQFRDDDSLKKISVSLEPGIIEDGKINDSERLIKRLKELRGEFTLAREKIPIIAIIPSANVYTKVFSLPPLPENKLKEAASLNLESISPVNFKNAYMDWQMLDIQEKDGKTEILGAFAEKDAIDIYIQTLKTAGFLPIIVEFGSLAIARFVKQYASLIDFNQPHIVIHLYSDGITFMILRNGNLYFDYSIPWKTIQEDSQSAREISFSDFKNTIVREVKKIIIFYNSRWGGKLENLILITQALEEETIQLIKRDFNFEVVGLKISGLVDLSPVWFTAVGSALRGKMPRFKDKFINLTALRTEEVYFQSEAIFFFKLWRNAIATLVVFLFAIFVITDTFLAKTSNDLTNQARGLLSFPGGTEVVDLQEKARIFNQAVEKALIAKKQSPQFSPVFAKIDSLLQNINLIKLSINTRESSVFLTGRTDDERSALGFKNRLSQAGFKNVNLPLSELESKPDGSVSFSLTFSL